MKIPIKVLFVSFLISMFTNFCMQAGQTYESLKELQGQINIEVDQLVYLVDLLEITSNDQLLSLLKQIDQKMDTLNDLFKQSLKLLNKYQKKNKPQKNIEYMQPLGKQLKEWQDRQMENHLKIKLYIAVLEQK